MCSRRAVLYSLVYLDIGLFLFLFAHESTLDNMPSMLKEILVWLRL